MARRALLLLVPLALTAGVAGAQTRKGVRVTATVVAGCAVAIDAAGLWGRIDLGNVAGTDTGVVEAGLASPGGAGVTLDCTPGTVASLSADAGEHAAGGTRRLAHPAGAALPYELLVDGEGAPWRDQPVALAFPTGVQRRVVPIRARAALPGALPPGRYTDTVRVTLSW